MLGGSHLDLPEHLERVQHVADVGIAANERHVEARIGCHVQLPHLVHNLDRLNGNGTTTRLNYLVIVNQSEGGKSSMQLPGKGNALVFDHHCLPLLADLEYLRVLWKTFAYLGHLAGLGERRDDAREGRHGRQQPGGAHRTNLRSDRLFSYQAFQEVSCITL